MAYNENSPLTERPIPGGQLADISTASVSYAPIPFQGVIMDAFATISAAITTADGAITVGVIKSAVSATIGTITIPTASSAPGDTGRMVMSGTEIVRTVNPGDTIFFSADGVCNTTSIANFTAVMKGA